MSYYALARKWRPRTFSQLVGQEHINKILINSLNQQRVHHAYLFTGTRGVGKTSVARLMAKALNCEQGLSANPCLTCAACTAIEQGQFIDLIEIDAASKTRVEDTRDILENVQYAPTAGRYKIYLIDEVHMLSQHSFNALLKTLEEPPEHVKFLFATTDPQKIPITVLSRCLQFNLKHIEADIIAHQLKTILQEEKYAFEEEAITILAKAARGSMRDALSLLDQAIANGENCLKAQEVKKILGYTQQDYALKLLTALIDLNTPDIIKISRQIAAEGGHYTYVLEELLHYLHQITISQALTQEEQHFVVAPQISALAQQLTKEDVQLFYQIGLKGSEEMHLAPTLMVGFEMTMLRMITFIPISEVTLPAAEAKKINEAKRKPLTDIQSNDKPLGNPIVDAEPFVLADNSATSEQEADWTSIIKQLKLTGLTLNAAENTEMIEKTANKIVLKAANGHQSLFSATIIQRLEQALANYYQAPIKINLIFNEPLTASPAIKKQAAYSRGQQEAEKNLLADPVVQQLQEEFSAELVKSSIELLEDNL